MADYYSRFSCLLDLGSESNVSLALKLFEEQHRHVKPAWADEFDDELESTFEAERVDDNPAWLWIHDGGHGSQEYVPPFVLACAKLLHLEGRWGFQWALTCSAPRLDGFGGGAAILDLTGGTVLDRVDSHKWLREGSPTNPEC